MFRFVSFLLEAPRAAFFNLIQALRHFLFTIPLGCLITTGLVMYVIPLVKPNITWYELYVMLVALNIAVTVLAYVLMPGLPALRRPASR